MLTEIQVVVKNPSDFIGSVIGQSEANTKAILASTLGKMYVTISPVHLIVGLFTRNLKFPICGRTNSTSKN